MSTNFSSEIAFEKTAQYRFLVVGLVRNSEGQVKEDVRRLKSAIGQTKRLDWLLIESDSSDSTVDDLRELSLEIENFKFMSLGILGVILKPRTERIAHCRNTYLYEIRQNALYQDVDYIIVADFDGINTSISKSGIESCWQREDWDMCAANQNGPYYDIWALRHRDWSPNDCYAQYNFLNQYEINTKKNLRNTVHSRMITIPASRDWIAVDSAFGGLAIYKKKLFDFGEYRGLSEMGEEICEHIHFHEKLILGGARLFINPALITAEYTEHTEILLLSKRILQSLKTLPRRAIKTVLGRHLTEKLRIWLKR